MPCSATSWIRARACSCKLECRERHWCRQLFERGLSLRAAFEAQISTKVLRQDQSRSSVHHEGCAGKSGPHVVRYRLRKCPAERQSFFLAGAFASSSNATPRALARRRVGIDGDVHVSIKGSPDLPVRGLGDALPRYQHEVPVARRAGGSTACKRHGICISAFTHRAETVPLKPPLS